MTDPVPPSSGEARLDKSHALRAMFEQWAYMASIGIVIATMLVLLFGVAYPPPVPDTKVADWGAAIVARLKDAVPVLGTLLTFLASFSGITLFRGHMDARLSDRDPT